MTFSLQVLIVEDNTTVRFLLMKQLETLGITADSAHNGIAALSRVQNCKYSLIFMDLQMPEMDGYEAASAIRQFEKDHFPESDPVPIIAVTAGGDASRARTAGIDEIIQKPLLLDQLRIIIRKWLPGYSRNSL